ncbi:hypothetical protein [Streptomyces actinomycinicus]|uniref:hypothetical protein n=1 Tax=Streptomyces actinomycinicus TaxID=1695166 RepID=UPI001F3297F5|nr:hypothetical protein [Streptomyces actinomycinicus]
MLWAERDDEKGGSSRILPDEPPRAEQRTLQAQPGKAELKIEEIGRPQQTVRAWWL